MAVYNEIQVGRYVRFLQKFLSIKGRQPAPLQFSGELGAFWTLFHGAENRYLESWNRFGLSITAAAGGVGNTSAIQFRTPQRLDLIAVLEKLTVTAAGAADTPFALLQKAPVTDLTTVASVINSNWDTRGLPQPSSIISSTTAVGAVSGRQVWQGAFPVAQTTDMITTDIQEIALLGGDAIQIRSNAANQALIVTFFWRERSLEESEQK